MKLTRRRFLSGCAGGLVLAACKPVRASLSPHLRPSWDGMGELRTTYRRDVIQRMLDSGIRAITVTLSDPKLEGHEALTDGMKSIREYEAFIHAHPDLLLAARSTNDVQRAEREGKIAIFYLFQNSTPFDNNLDNVGLFYKLGLRSCQVTYNTCSLSGCGSRMPQGGGLTAFGRELVARMNEQRMLVDLAHANMATMADTIRVSKGQVIISHTGCSAIYPSYRNTTDENLRLLAEKGGVAGIYQIRPFLTAASSATALPDYFRHISHAVDVCGAESVAIASDRDYRQVTMTPEYLAQTEREEGTNFNKAEWPLYIDKLNGPSRMEVVRTGLRKLGYSERDCDRIMIGNLKRVYREVIG